MHTKKHPDASVRLKARCCNSSLLLFPQILEQRLLPPIAFSFLQHRDIQPIQEAAAFGHRDRVIETVHREVKDTQRFRKILHDYPVEKGPVVNEGVNFALLQRPQPVFWLRKVAMRDAFAVKPRVRGQGTIIMNTSDTTKSADGCLVRARTLSDRHQRYRDTPSLRPASRLR